MPSYDYRCPACGVFEVSQRITAPALETCPRCGKPVRRLIGKNVAIIYKANGFYVTDNRKTKPETNEESQAETKKEESTTVPG